MWDIMDNYAGSAIRKFTALLQESPPDFTIQCGNRTFEVHKSIISVHSDYFGTACRSDSFKEGETGIIKLKAIGEGNDDEEDYLDCDDPEVIEKLVEYFYSMDYRVPRNEHYDERFTFHAKVYAAATKYQVWGLKSLVETEFDYEASSVINNYKYVGPLEDLIEAAEIIYTATPDTDQHLRYTIVNTIDRNDLLDEKDPNDWFVQAVGKIPGLCQDIMWFDHGIRHDQGFIPRSKRMSMKESRRL